jgi:hypothetical protein
MARAATPSLAWDNLFDNRGSLQNLSILDRVEDRAQDLSKCISGTDKGKLDEYLTSVREVEKRVEGMRKDKTDADDAAKAKNTIAATMERPANGLPEDLRDHARLMCDIIAIAFQTNKTRVASLIISHDLSAMYLSLPRCEGWPPFRLAQQQLRRIRAHLSFPCQAVPLPGL